MRAWSTIARECIARGLPGILSGSHYQTDGRDGGLECCFTGYLELGPERVLTPSQRCGYGVKVSIQQSDKEQMHAVQIRR